MNVESQTPNPTPRPRGAARPGAALGALAAAGWCFVPLVLPWVNAVRDGRPVIAEYSLEAKELFLQGAVALLLVLWTTARLLRLPGLARLPGALGAYALFLAAALLPLFFAAELAVNVDEGLWTWKRLAVLGAALWLTAELVSTECRWWRLSAAVLVGTFLTAALGVAQALTGRALAGLAPGRTLTGAAGWFLERWQALCGVTHPITPTNAPGTFAVTFVAATYVNLGVAFAVATLAFGNSRGLRKLALAALACQLAFIGLSKTRTAWVALAAALLVLAVLAVLELLRRRGPAPVRPLGARAGSEPVEGRTSASFDSAPSSGSGAALRTNGSSGAPAACAGLEPAQHPRPTAARARGARVVAVLLALPVLAAAAAGAALWQSQRVDPATLTGGDDPHKASFVQAWESILKSGGDKGRIKRYRETLCMLGLPPVGLDMDEPVKAPARITLAAGGDPLAAARPEEGAPRTRADFWTVADEFPVFGYGPGHWRLHYPKFVSLEWEENTPRNFTADAQPRRAHSDHLETLVETGVPGFVCYALFWLLLLGAAWGLWRRGTTAAERAIGLCALLAALLYGVHGAFDFPREMSGATLLFALAAGAALGAAARRRAGAARWSPLIAVPIAALAVAAALGLGLENVRFFRSQRETLTARTALHAGDWVNARDGAYRALEYAAWNQKAAYYWAYALNEMSDGSTDLPETAVAHALRLNPWSLEALTLKARIFLKRPPGEAHYRAAAETLRACLEIHQQNPYALTAAGDLMARYGREEEAERFYQRAVENKPEVPGPGGIGSRIELRDLLARFGLLREQRGLALWAEADAAGEAAEGHTRRRARALLDEAVNFYISGLASPAQELRIAALWRRQHKIAPTATLLTLTHERFPEDPRVAAALLDARLADPAAPGAARTSFAPDEYEGLIALARQAAEGLGARDPQGRRAAALADELRAEQMLADAAEALRGRDFAQVERRVADLRALDDRAAGADWLTGALCRAQHDPRAAAAAFETALTRSRSRPALLAELAEQRRTEMHVFLGEFYLSDAKRLEAVDRALALDAYRKAAAHQPSHWRIWEGLAFLQAETGAKAEALDSYRRLFETIPFAPEHEEFLAATEGRVRALLDEAAPADPQPVRRALAQWSFWRGLQKLGAARRAEREAQDEPARAAARAEFAEAKQWFDRPELEWGVQDYDQKYALIDCEFALGAGASAAERDQTIERARNQMFSAQQLARARGDRRAETAAWDHFETLKARFLAARDGR